MATPQSANLHLGKLVEPPQRWQRAAMNTLAEIESAAAALPEQEQEKLFLFLAARLRTANPAELPPPRQFSPEQMAAWIRDDEEGMRRFREGR